jgi:molybdopterin-synthase adenylyltransferase
MQETDRNLNEGKVTHIDGRVKMLGPGMGCLVCHGGILSPAQVRWDLANERERRADPYFTEDSNIKQPSVISLNSTAASLATTMFLSAVAGIRANARSQVYRGVLGVVRTMDDTPRQECVVCSKEYFYGKGDQYALPARID